MHLRTFGRRPSLLSAAFVMAAAVMVTGCVTPTTAGRLPVVLHPVIVAHAPHVKGPAVSGLIRQGTGTGEPVVGATVYLSVALSGAEQATRGTKATFSFGLLCLDREGCSAPTSRGVTARDGTYDVAVPTGGDPQDKLELTAIVARGTARVATSVELPATAHRGMALPALPVAAGVPQLVGTPSHLSMQVPPVPGAQLGSPVVTMSTVADVGPGAQLLVNDQAIDVSAGFDPRIVEDGRVILESTQQGQVGLLPAEVSASLVVRGKDIPASRQAACAVTGSRGQPMEQRPCGLTDGILDTTWMPKDDPLCRDGPCPGTAQHDQRDVVVTFADPIPATLLVVRGCGFTCHVYVTDALGEQALPAPSQDSPDGIYVQPLVGLGIRSVRIATSTGGFFDALREVSLFS